MKKKSVLQIISLCLMMVLFTACSGSSGNGSGSLAASPATDPVDDTVDDGDDATEDPVGPVAFASPAEIKELDDENNQIHKNLGVLDFGTRTSTDQILNPERIIQIRNSGDDLLFFNMEIKGQGEFFIVEEDCGQALEAKETCDVKIQMTGGERKNGRVRSSLWVSSRGNDMVIQLEGNLNLQGNEYSEDDDDDGATVIDMDIAWIYRLGSAPIQRVIVSNDGDDPLSGLDLMITSAYEIYANNCPSVLEEGDYCKVYVKYKTHTTIEFEDPLFGFLRAMSDMSDDYILSLTGGEVVSEPQ